MAADRPNPLDLTTATRLPPSQHARTFSRSRSPARSPARKAQFAARELDPLLKNLSPDSTLEALQKTNTIGSSPAEQNALAQSISDASESERELGIRAAIAAKKLKEWTQEVNTWTWPSSSDRAWGAGFVPKQNVEGENIRYLGSLPDFTVQHYEDRLDEIWDAMDTLGMDEIKEYVFSSHHPASSNSSISDTTKTTSSGYGRMRDFTALITATVVQSLPVLANLYVLLETWSIRLTILRQIPDLLLSLQQVRQGLVAINDIIHDESKSRNVTPKDFEQGKAMFGNRVSNLGKRVDKLLDMLEGQGDSLPQAWIDALEDIEGKYAEWVAKAEQVILRNQMKRDEPTHTGSPTITTSLQGSVSTHPLATDTRTNLSSMPQSRSGTNELPAATPIGNTATPATIKRKPLLDTTSRVEQGHRRGISELSAAESNLSMYSLENAEIADAQRTTMLPGPHVSLVDNPVPHHNNIAQSRGRDISELPVTQADLPQRSLTIPAGNRPRETRLNRSASNPTRGIHVCRYHRASSVPRVPTLLAEPLFHRKAGDLALNPNRSRGILTPLAVSPSPSLRVDPLTIRGRELAIQELDSRPSVPRRSSKRMSLPNGGSSDEILVLPISPETGVDNSFRNRNQSAAAQSPDLGRQQTFDDKLKSILASMPTKIKLTDTSDSGSASGSNSGSSTRASSPQQTLKLSPVKDGKSGRGANTSGIHVYHLSRTGTSRDSPPIKLFVRAVGEHGERLMVRVGGGWADLAEYLREYSLHHGGRGVVERQLEVANYPGQHKQRGQNTLTFNPVISVREIDNGSLSESSSTIDHTFDFGIPNDYSRTMVDHDSSSVAGTATGQDPTANTNIAPSLYTSEPHARSPSPAFYASPDATPETEAPRILPGLSTTISPVPYTNRYTPLGAAGPVQNSRRAVSYNQNRTQPQANQAWVQGMVNQARAVSGGYTRSSPGSQTSTIITTPTYATRIIGNVQIVEQPTITTTTTISSSRRTPTSARPVSSPRTISNSSAFQNFQSNDSTPLASGRGTARPSAITSPAGSQLSNATASSVSNASYVTANTSRPESGQSRNRASGGGDVGGIRRVFLRNRVDRG